MPVPKPLPGASPVEAWLNRPLVAVDATMGETPLQAWSELRGTTIEPGMRRNDFGPAAYRRLESTSLQDAITAASAISQANGRIITDNVSRTPATFSSAMAVLQAKDGAFWATALGTTPAGGMPVGGFASIDPEAPLSITDVRRLHPDVQAVVGAASFVNFTDAQVAPTLAKPPA